MLQGTPLEKPTQSLTSPISILFLKKPLRFRNRYLFKAMSRFQLQSKYVLTGDQPQAVDALLAGFAADAPHQTLLGVTGSGKTFIMANVIAQLQRPTLVIAPNKILAAQLYQEFQSFFPHNAVEYFVSYYDYFQPEAYVPSRNVYIEKDSSQNDELDRMRLAATYALFEREDVIIVASVSCIYGLGSPEQYKGMKVYLRIGDAIERELLLARLVESQYKRNDYDFHRGCFRVRGDVVEVFPANAEDAIRIELFGDEVEAISRVDPVRGTKLELLTKAAIYPATHYATPQDQMPAAVQQIRQELQARLIEFKSQKKLLEAQRLEQRTLCDVEMLEETGSCKGIENYSRILQSRAPGSAGPTLLDFFPRQSLLFIDESHVTVPQLGAMNRGDISRKTTLVDHGFRLPCALDNRPLTFAEFEQRIDQAVYVSATPGPYEIEHSGGAMVEAVVRPTGLLDPPIEVRPIANQVDDLLDEIRTCTEKKERVLATTLTKRMSEDLTKYYEDLGVRVRYMHSENNAIERAEILRDLRLGEFDVLIGINLLREGLDIPEVALVAILDADKEGYLRSYRSLMQTCGRAARNVGGRVIFYADRVTDSMRLVIEETERRQTKQRAYNARHGITPTQIVRDISASLVPTSTAQATLLTVHGQEIDPLDHAKMEKQIKQLQKQMLAAAKDLDFEGAAQYRDALRDLKRMQLGVK